MAASNALYLQAAGRHRNTKASLYIYIYIYICVCVCVSILDLASKFGFMDPRAIELIVPRFVECRGPQGFSSRPEGLR